MENSVLAIKVTGQGQLWTARWKGAGGTRGGCSEQTAAVSFSKAMWKCWINPMWTDHKVQCSPVLALREFSIALEFPGFSSTLDVIMESLKDPEGHLESKPTCFLYVLCKWQSQPRKVITVICDWHSNRYPNMWGYMQDKHDTEPGGKGGKERELSMACLRPHSKLSDCKQKSWHAIRWPRENFSLLIPSVYSIFK